MKAKKHPPLVESSAQGNEFVVIYTTTGRLVAEVIKGKLTSAGIPAVLKYESLGLVYGVTVNGLGQVQVLVPAHRAREARELLKESDA